MTPKLLIFLTILISVSLVQSRVIDFSKNMQLLKHLQVHACRQKCYLETLTDEGHYMDYKECQGVPDCYMCYDYCELLPISAVNLAHAICSDEAYCSEGCRIACHHHRILRMENLEYEIHY